MLRNLVVNLIQEDDLKFPYGRFYFTDQEKAERPYVFRLKDVISACYGMKFGQIQYDPNDNIKLNSSQINDIRTILNDMRRELGQLSDVCQKLENELNQCMEVDTVERMVKHTHITTGL